ncbi:MAG: 1-acyl-sn-glycerol-3-phosphate acyltransferase, partial [Waterburya sp.]
MIQAQPSLEFIPPAYNPLVWQITKKILPLWLRYNQDIISVKIDNAEELIELYDQFDAGQTRFMLAFRHPAVTDAPCIAQLLWNQLPQISKQQGKALKSPV